MSALLDPRLADCRRIFLRDLALQVSIGFHDFEREAPQRVLVNVDVFVPLLATTPTRDHVSEVLDYDRIRTGIVELAGSRHFDLQETLVDGIIALCFALPDVRAVLASTQKPDVYPDCRTVGIEVLRFREGDAGPMADLDETAQSPARTAERGR